MRSTWLAGILLLGWLIDAEPTRAGVIGGIWSPTYPPSATYCFGNTCTEAPLDASVGMGSEGLVNMSITLNFPQFGRPVPLTIHAVVDADQAFPFGRTLESGPEAGSLLSYSIAFVFTAADRMTMDGFAQLNYEGQPRAEVSFGEHPFVPIPEPSVAALLSLGLLGLGVTRSSERMRSALDSRLTL